MAYIRNQERMVYQTVLDYVRSQLDVLGWLATDPNLLPWGATVPLTWLEETPDPKLESLRPNTVAFAEGQVPDDIDLELGAAGGGLWSSEHTFFIDVYGESLGVAKALASDLRAVLTGRLPGTHRYQPMLDYSVVPAVPAPGHLLHWQRRRA